MRISVLLVLLPVFGSRMLPNMFKAGLALAMTFLIAPLVPARSDPAGSMVTIIFREMLFGATLGFSVRVFFSAVEMAAQWASIEMGLSVAGVFDPQFGASVSPLTRFQGMLALAAFFVLDLHHVVLWEIVRSFSIQPAEASLVRTVLELGADLFEVAFRLAAPLFLVQVIANLTLGLLARAMPQANILAVGFPVMVGVGFVAFLAVTPYLLHLLAGLRIVPAFR